MFTRRLLTIAVIVGTLALTTVRAEAFVPFKGTRSGVTHALFFDELDERMPACTMVYLLA
ncbi:MAG TPA: hypothetical protein VFX12_03610 [Vicinamibacterales bacterium]|nr:hypothetical protein [Vicinamibacterales bacterium]